MVYNYDGSLAIINLLIWLILLLTYKSEFFRYTAKKSSYSFLFLMVVLYTTFGFSEADTYHYHNLYDQMLKFGHAIHVEEFYFWLIRILPHNYYIWRFVVWGLATLLTIATFKRFNLNAHVVGFVFPMILLQEFVVTRGALGIALFLFSASFLIKPGKYKLISFLFGVIGSVCALSLHHSLPLFVLISLFALIPLNKVIIIALIILYPILRLVVIPFIFSIIESGLLSSNTEDFATLYLESEKNISNINGIIRLIIEYLPRFLIFFILVKEYIFSRVKELPKYFKLLFQYSFLLFYVALLCFGQETSSFIASRTIHMMCFPLTIVLSYHLSINNNRTYLLQLTMALFIFANLFTFLYTIYKW